MTTKDKCKWKGYFPSTCLLTVPFMLTSTVCLSVLCFNTAECDCVVIMQNKRDWDQELSPGTEFHDPWNQNQLLLKGRRQTKKDINHGPYRSKSQEKEN